MIVVGKWCLPYRLVLCDVYRPLPRENLFGPGSHPSLLKGHAEPQIKSVSGGIPISPDDLKRVAVVKHSPSKEAQTSMNEDIENAARYGASAIRPFASIKPDRLLRLRPSYGSPPTMCMYIIVSVAVSEVLLIRRRLAQKRSPSKYPIDELWSFSG
jgi:hypothetical protein